MTYELTVIITPTWPKPPAYPDAAEEADKQVVAANAAVASLLKSTEVIDALAARSSPYIPMSTSKVTSMLWGVFNVKGSSSITEADVTRAVLDNGGSSANARGLWAQLNPAKKSEIHALEFTINPFLPAAITPNLKDLETAITQSRLQDAGKSNSLLDSFAGGGLGAMLNVSI